MSLSGAVGASPASEKKFDFDIPSGPARETTHLLAQQSGRQMLFEDAALGSLQTHAVHAHTDVQGAVNHMWAQLPVECTVMPNRVFLMQPSKHRFRRCTVDSPAPSLSPQHTSDSSAPGTAEPIEEVLITGSWIHGTKEPGAESVSFDENHPLWLGANTVAQVLRRYPTDFKGGPSEDTQLSPEAITNSGSGISADLRGVGARASLTLMNARRLAPSGSQAAFVDVLQIPLIAVQRIDVVMDGASSTYGADAVGGVVNIITRQRFNGTRLIADIGEDPDGSQHQYRFGFLGGTDWGEGHGVLALEAYGREALAADRRLLSHSDLRPWGPDLGSPYADLGTLTSSLGTFALPTAAPGASIDFRRLQAGTQNSADIYQGADNLPRQGRGSVYGAVHQELTDHLEGFANLLWSERWTSQNLVTQPISIAISSDTRYLTNVPPDVGPLRLESNLGNVLGARFAKTNIRSFDLTLGLDFDSRSGWRGQIAGTDSLEQQHQLTYNAGNATAIQTAIANGTFNPFDGSPVPLSIAADSRTHPWFGLRSQFWEVNANIDGPVIDLPAGKLQVGFGGEYRNQLLRTASFSGDLPSVDHTNLGRSLWAAYTEIKIPLVSPQNAVPAIENLELSASGRYENTSDFGSSSTPRYWLIYSPYADIQVRSSFAHSTRAPNLGDLDERQNVSFLASVRDPQNPGNTTQVLGWGGGNAKLRPEHATSYTFGLRYAPESESGSFAELSYFHIASKDRIQTTATDTVNGVLPEVLEQSPYRSVVYRNPSETLRTHVCSTTQFGGINPDDCDGAPIAAIVDLRSLNIATLVTQGVDLSMVASQDISLGTLTGTMWASYLLDYREKITPAAPSVSFLNTAHYPINLQLVSTLNWDWRGFTAQLRGNYANGYRDPSNLVKPSVRSWLTVDAELQYQLAARAGSWMNDLVFGISVENLFNRGPPPMANQLARLGYDQENGELSGQIIRLRVAKQWPAHSHITNEELTCLAIFGPADI